jgi:hypothetical protein
MSSTVYNSIFNWCSKMKKIINCVTTLVTRYIIGIIFSISFLFLYNYFMPMSNWITYVSVEPLQEENKIGEELFFITTRNVKRDSHVHWLDILVCNNRNIQWRYSAMISEGNIKTRWLQKKSRLYTELTPTTRTICYLESHTKLQLAFGITKEQVVKSWPFYFVP